MSDQKHNNDCYLASSTSRKNQFSVYEAILEFEVFTQNVQLGAKPKFPRFIGLKIVGEKI
jgi:hypothetical protein